ncbi:unnamed protein product [Dracunculus medinensis]|uniref:Uncharacterized protein n=1 Tax=Dracunculus medinensis TaxID=318479 RepID=A0A0N4U4J9_DRAME|nr:unnamed protein product [Dracunculus medinensis]
MQNPSLIAELARYTPLNNVYSARMSHYISFCLTQRVFGNYFAHKVCNEAINILHQEFVESKEQLKILIDKASVREVVSSFNVLYGFFVHRAEILPQPGDYQESEAVEKMYLELEKLSAELMSQEAKQSLKESLNTLTTPEKEAMFGRGRQVCAKISKAILDKIIEVWLLSHHRFLK